MNHDDDNYDDFDADIIDETIPIELGDTETLLNQVIDKIATAPNVPLSSTPRIDRDNIVGLLQDAAACLPDEIRQARWMLKERTEFMAKTQRDADEIVEAARVQAERLVQRTEVVRSAETRARQVLEAADTDSRRLKNETEDFLDRRLGSFEILLDRLTRTVAQGRQRLSISNQSGADDEVLTDPSDENLRSRDGFFDQDKADDEY
jgi:cell division septum initiation protein DivIVA